MCLALSPAGRATGSVQAADRPTPFHAGEVLTYDVSWSGAVTAGTATMTVKERQPTGQGAFAYDLVAEGKPNALLDKLYHVYYRSEALLDTRTLLPSIATLFSDEHGRTKLRTTRFTTPTSIDFEPATGAPKEKHTVPKLTLDPLSALYVIRAGPAKAGQITSMSVVDDGNVYLVRWKFGSLEQIKTAIGTLSAWPVVPTVADDKGKPVSQYSKMAMWLSDDARRVPLKLEAGLSVGSFTLTLSKITP
jgi:hypothetical protein